MRKVSKFWPLFLLPFLFAMCKNKDKVRETKGNINQANFIKVLEKKALKWEFIRMDANVDYKTDPLIPKLNCYLRMKKDEIIWMSVRSIIGELARIKIDKDSIHALMRFPKKEYHVLPISYLNKYIPGMQGIQEVQKILLNEAPFPLEDYSWKNRSSLDSFTLFTDNEVLRSYLFGERVIGRIIDCHVSNPEGDYHANIFYDNPQNVGKKTLPYSLEIHGNAGRDSVNILVNYTKVEVKDDLPFPFQVGKSYERK